MAKVTAADLKKHHYWILSGLAPLFALLAALFLYVRVGDAYAKAAGENDKAVKEVSDTKPKGTQALADYEDQKKVLVAQKEKLWKFSYETQKAMFAWPKNPRLQQLEQRYVKFGQPITREDESLLQIAQPGVYTAAYDRLADSVQPTAFAGGTWPSVLRHVSNWGDKVPTDKQLWLALEDLWVQRGLLQPVTAVNAAAAVFAPVPPAKGEKDDPLKRTFESRIWRLELEVPKQAVNGQRLIECKLTNKTDRLQVLGKDNTMVLRVTVSPGGPPVTYRIQAPLVPANHSVEIRANRPNQLVTADADKKGADQPKVRQFAAAPRFHGVPAGVDPVAVTRVVQVLDAQNAPVRRIDEVVLGARAKDARHSPAELKPPKWYPAPEAGAADPAATGGPPGMMPGGPPGGAGSPDGEGGMPGMGGMAGMMGGMAGGGGAKTGGPRAVLDGNRNRYIDVTDQVRRMPVAVVLVVDQMFLQDALAAYANSPLRFQVTQFHWTRFRGTLDTPGSSTLTGGPPGGMPGMPGGSPDGGGEEAGPGGFGRGGMGGYPGGMSGGYPGMTGGFGGMTGGFGGPAVSEEQLTSGLVSLSLYGIVTLYERYEEPKPADGGTPAAPPADGAPTPPAAPPGSPASPTAPTPPAGTPPADPKN